MGFKFKGAGVVVDTDPIDLSDVSAKEWSPRLRDVRAYGYVRFYSFERADYGVFISTEGPKGEWKESAAVGNTRFDGIAPYGTFGDAIGEVNDKSMFEEVPLVEVLLEEDYAKAVLAQLGENLDDPGSWKLTSLQEVKDGDWEGPGLYDFRDKPPTFSGTVDEYEVADMEFWAEDTLDYMYQGDEWKSTLRTLLAEAA